MPKPLRSALAVLALVVATASWPRAQEGAAQKPPDQKPAAAPAADAQKPAEPAKELPDEAKAFNAAAGEKNPLKRAELLEKFIADNPKASSQLVNTARSQMNAAVLAAYKESRAKFVANAETEVADAAKRADTMPAYSTYNRLASQLVTAGIYSEEAEDFARKGLAAMNEGAYMDMRRKSYERMLASYEKAAAQAKQPKPVVIGAAAADAPAPAAPPAPASPNYRFATKDGVMQASLAPPAPPRPAAPPRPPTKPQMPTDDEMRTSFKSERASALATLGQVLVKRGKTEEGEKALAEAYAAKPASSTMAAISRTLAELAKKAGNDSLQLEYLTVLALSGRITADETKEFEAAYRKTHNDSLDGLEAMLDARYRREHTRFAVTPYTRPAKPTGRTVLAEVFPGAG
jgi:hypothetical protein